MTVSAATRERVAAFLDSDYARVVGTVALATGDRERAEDAVQDAIVKTLSGDTEPENLSGWITVVAINYVKQAWRRTDAQGRAYVRSATWEDESDTESDQILDTITIREALENLPERQRIVVTLHYLDGLTVAQIAQTLDITSGTVKTQLSRGRGSLAKFLKTEAA
ncbi:RNA polymerase sigma factor [Demequina aurantiaca]|uniref:RNA polymerase sigma factor n=1 Tax=Demequina aurantiaca TaxID=676200 RepID=UPI003D34EC44